MKYHTFIESMERRTLLAAGLPDYSFGRAGEVVTTDGGVQTAVRVVVQSDGKFVVLAMTKKGVALLRYQSGGALDTSFGTKGIVNLGSITPTELTLDKQGRYIVGADKRIERLTVAGKFDTTFGDKGVVKTTSRVTALIVRSDGRIIAGDDAGLMRQYRANGVVDRSFGSEKGGGILLSSATGIHDISIADLQRQRDGRIIVLASANLSEPDLVIMRVNTNLTLDKTFASGNGFVALDQGDDHPSTLAISPKDKIVASVSVGSTPSVVRLQADGNFDATFGDAGVVNVDRNNLDTFDSFTAPVAIDRAGHILIAARTQNPNGGQLGFGMVRLNDDGSLDSSFSYDGQAALFFANPENDQPRDLALTSSGKILVVGGENAVKIAQFDNEGADPPFVSLVARKLTITGTPRADFIEVDRNHSTEIDEVEVFFNRESAVTFKPSQISSIVIDAGGGDDQVSYLAFKSVTAIGGAGNDLITSQDFSDATQRSTLSGGPGDDTLTGDRRSNLLEGNDGNDSLIGGRGNDILNGGAGDDTLNADERAAGAKLAEADQVIGGTGVDSALFDEKDTTSEIEKVLNPPE